MCLGGGGLGGGSKITFLGVKLDFKLSSELVLLAKLNLIFRIILRTNPTKLGVQS